MKIVYEQGDTITLRRICDVSQSDWDDVTPGIYTALKNAMQRGDTFTVDCEATDDYYSITNDETGRSFEAISVYHLKPVPFGTLETMLDL